MDRAYTEPPRPDAPPGLRVAFQGEAGAYSHEALEFALGPGTDPVPCRDFKSLIRSVVAGEADLGMLPVENSLAGAVGGAVDALLDADLEPVAEVVRPIRHCLLGLPQARAESVSRVLSHPVALAQCLGFFEGRPDLEAVAVHDTAGAARMVRDGGDASVAAIASASAAARYGLEVLARDLQDRDDNQTRFLVVRRPGHAAAVPSAGPLRSLVVFETADRPGALVDVLMAFARHGLNLSRLASRPGRIPWTYRFVAEVDADLRDGSGRQAVEDTRSRTRLLEVRGPYAEMPAHPVAGRPGADAPALVAGPEPTPPAAHALERVRASIDRVDERLVHLLADRLRLAREAQALRDRDGRGGYDPPREARVVRRAAEAGRDLGLPEEALRKVLWDVVALCAPLSAGSARVAGTGGR